MRLQLVFILVFVFSNLSFSQKKDKNKNQEEKPANSFEDKVTGLKKYPGFLDFYFDEAQDRVLLVISRFNEEILYISSLTTGVGSNDIGLDRGQLGREHVVKFERRGPKVLMIEPNYRYRAITANESERKSVEEAFASSVLWGFKIEAEGQGVVLVDATDFFLQDVHDVGGRLKSLGQGEYSVDKTRSAFYLPRTKNFAENSEFEITITLTGRAMGELIQSVTPSANAVSVRQHHSFVKLPDTAFEPRRFDPRAGYFEMSFYDYATPIDQPIEKRFITRHRLKKKDPNAAVSEPVEPIIYYLDNGTPEPIRSALLDGARWWSEAFEGAGFRNAFRVEILPDDADPMDVR
jgi:hypothetical protein